MTTATLLRPTDPVAAEDEMAALVTRHLEVPRAITADHTLADLGITCEVHLLSVQCDVEEQIVHAELPHGAVRADMTLADLVALAEAHRGRGL